MKRTILVLVLMALAVSAFAEDVLASDLFKNLSVKSTKIDIELNAVRSSTDVLFADVERFLSSVPVDGRATWSRNSSSRIIQYISDVDACNRELTTISREAISTYSDLFDLILLTIPDDKVSEYKAGAYAFLSDIADNMERVNWKALDVISRLGSLYAMGL